MTVRIKIVPDAAPNDDGRWIDVEAELPATTKWREADDLLKLFIPQNHHMVGYERGKDQL